jgi:mRNA interferase RelE/StbE
MAYYKILWKRSAEKELSKLDRVWIKKILEEIERLQHNPMPSQSKKLSGSENTYRIRVSDYRIIYEVFKKEIEILIIKIGHRKDVYRNI